MLHGVITRGEALADGVAPAAIARRVQRGVWTRLHEGVYLVEQRTSMTDRWYSELAGHIMRMNGTAVVSHRSAAALHHLDGFDGGFTELTVPLNCGHAGPFRRSGTLRVGDIVTLNGLAVTSLGRTILDLAAVVGADVLEQAVESALRIDPSLPDAWKVWLLADLRERASAADRIAGAARLRAVLALRDDADRPTGSLPETLLLQAARARGLTLFRQPEVRVFGRRGELLARFWPDFGVCGVILLVEVDGSSAHGTSRALDRDLVRQNQLSDVFSIQRFSAERVFRDPARVAAEIDARARICQRGTSLVIGSRRVEWTGAGYDVFLL